MDGELIYKYLKNNGIAQQDMLKKSRYSRAKLYGLFKQNRFLDKEKKAFIEDFILPADFFDNKYEYNKTENTGISNDPVNTYEIEMLKEIIKSKDELIQQQKEMISQLLKKRG